MRTILFTNARDESNILEWVVHHMNIGFTHIYIVDHMSKIPLSEVLKNIPPGRITIKRVNHSIVKVGLMKDAYIHARRYNYLWMLYLDCDEFLVLNNDSNLDSFLEKYNHQQYSQIGINWLMFGTNNMDNTPTGTIIENYTRCDTHLDMHVKSFLCLHNEINSIPNPHVFIIPNMDRSVGVNYNILDAKTPWWYKNNDDYKTVDAYIAHYVYQSYSRYIERKVIIPRDDTNTFRDQTPPEELHKLYNQSLNTDIMQKYNQMNIQMIREYE